MEIYQSNLGILILDIIKELGKKKFLNARSKFLKLKDSMKTRIVNEFFSEKERTRMESVFSET